MTKVYLVKVTYYVNKTYYDLVANVFTNRKLAETFCEFKNKQPSPKWFKENDFRTYQTCEYDICKLDYTDDLLKLKNG